MVTICTRIIENLEIETLLFVSLCGKYVERNSFHNENIKPVLFFK